LVAKGRPYRNRCSERELHVVDPLRSFRDERPLVAPIGTILGASDRSVSAILGANRRGVFALDLPLVAPLPDPPLERTECWRHGCCDRGQELEVSHEDRVARRARAVDFTAQRAVPAYFGRGSAGTARS
jgi:hypothetical protein